MSCFYCLLLLIRRRELVENAVCLACVLHVMQQSIDLGAETLDVVAAALISLTFTAARFLSTLSGNDSFLCNSHYDNINIKLSPRGRRDDMPPPMAVRLAADLRPSADWSAVRTWLSCKQPACL